MGVGQRSLEDVVTLGERRPLADLARAAFGGRRILVTGHNGFVGSWLTLWLLEAGAEVFGLSFAERPGELAEQLGLARRVDTVVGDVRDPSIVTRAVERARPDHVFHLAAQPIVLTSYHDPIGTFATNVMGTVHLLDALRGADGLRSCVVVTSDKCYAAGAGAHVEGDPLGGDDPYSASKGAAEVVAHGMRHSFFAGERGVVATARAGNIVGGGDYAPDRILPDCVRASMAGQPVRLRHPEAVRPWQHVLDAVAGYLRLAAAIVDSPARFDGAWNFGPPPEAATDVGHLVSLFVGALRAHGMATVSPVAETSVTPAERAFLTLDSTKARTELGWSQLLGIDATASWTAEWYARSLVDAEFDAAGFTRGQIARYLELDAENAT